MEDFWIDVLDFTRTITTEVGSQLKLDFGQVQATRKPDGTLVTASDKWADEVIRKAITARFPTTWHSHRRNSPYLPRKRLVLGCRSYRRHNQLYQGYSNLGYFSGLALSRHSYFWSSLLS